MALIDLSKPDPNRNRRNGFIMALIMVLYLAIIVKCSGQVYKATDIPIVLGRTDSLSKLELLTAKKFHAKLNEHRKKNGVPPVRWSDTLYILAMNHNAWMRYNKTTLMHYQTMNTAHFTGEEPKNRLDYVCDTKTFGTSENIAWFSWGNRITIEQMAEIASLAAISSWKSDKPHNDNMLNKWDRVHAIHFSYKGGYCTSEFSGNRIVKN